MNCFRGFRTPFSFKGFGKLVSWANPLCRHGERAGFNTAKRKAGATRQNKALAILDIVTEEVSNFLRQRISTIKLLSSYGLSLPIVIAKSNETQPRPGDSTTRHILFSLLWYAVHMFEVVRAVKDDPKAVEASQSLG
jgi:hypothetical protein